MSDLLKKPSVDVVPARVPRVCGFVTIRWEGKIWLCERGLFEQMVKAGELPANCAIH